MDIKTGNAKLVDNNVNYTSLSPDDKKLAYIKGDNALLCLYLKSDYLQVIDEYAHNAGMNNIWSPDSTRLVYQSKDKEESSISYLTIYNVMTEQRTMIPNNQYTRLDFLDWVDENHFLVSCYRDSDKKGIVALYDFKNETLKKTEKSVYNHESMLMKGESIVGFKTITEQSDDIYWLIYSGCLNNKKEKHILKLPQMIEEPEWGMSDGGLRYSGTFIKKIRFVHDNLLFYRMISSETELPVYAGIVDVNKGRAIQLDKNILDIYKSTTYK